MQTEKQLWRALEAVNVDRCVSAFPGLQVVGDLDETLKLPLKVTMTEDWMGYLNAHVMMQLEHYYGGSAAAWRFLPDRDNGQIIFLKAEDDAAYGAARVLTIKTGTGMRVNLRRPMQKLGVERLPGRVWSFSLLSRTGEDGREYIAITTAGATTRPVQPHKQNAPAIAQNPDEPG